MVEKNYTPLQNKRGRRPRAPPPPTADLRADDATQTYHTPERESSGDLDPVKTAQKYFDFATL